MVDRKKFKEMTKPELVFWATETERAVRRLNDDIRHYKSKIEAFMKQELRFQEAIMLLASRCDIKPAELAQLGVGTLIPAHKDANGKQHPATIQFASLDDLLTMTNAAMKEQATVAKFRQLKQHFQSHQWACTGLLNELEKLGRKNYLTTEDLRKFQATREEFSGIIRRKV